MTLKLYLTKVDLSSKVSCGIDVRAISQKMLINLIRYIRSEITLLKLLQNFPGASELNNLVWSTQADSKYWKP